MTGTPEASYFAVTGHYYRAGLTKLHYWYRVRTGRDTGCIKPWPPRRSHFGRLYTKDIPDAEWCREVFDCTPDEWVHFYFADVRDVAQDALTEIREHPEQAAARFAALQSHCCCCGKGLRDERSKAYGIGPECRAGLPPGVLARLSELTARQHAAAVQGDMVP